MIAAYDLLLSEGYVIGRGGSGTYVADVRPAFARRRASTHVQATDNRITPYWRSRAPLSDPALARAWRYDFRTGVPDVKRFPFDVWRNLSARSARALAKERIIREEPQGRQSLREAIAQHVSFARAVACSSDDVIVTTGTREALGLLARILVTPGKTRIAVEDPVFTPVRLAFEAAGARIASIPVDADGLLVDRLSPSARVIFVSPSHQFPLGVAMSARRRAALLDFARTYNAIVIEDDYDGEFRLKNRSLDALQSLDRAESVFYIGTFSKSLFPALRLGFIVTPPWARAALVAARQIADGQCAVLPQDTLATFIAEGHLARHIRKMRKLYSERHDALVSALARHCGERLRPIPIVTGVHLAAQLTCSVSAAEVSSRAALASIRVETIDRYAHRKQSQTGLAFGYGMIEAENIDPAILKLSRLLTS